VVTAAAPPPTVAGHRAATPNLHLPSPARRRKKQRERRENLEEEREMLFQNERN